MPQGIILWSQGTGSVLKRDAPEGELEEARRPLRRLQYLFYFFFCLFLFVSLCPAFQLNYELLKSNTKPPDSLFSP